MIKRVLCVVSGIFIILSLLMSPQGLPAHAKKMQNIDQLGYAKEAFQRISFEKINAQGDVLRLSADSAQLNQKNMVVQSPTVKFKNFKLTSKQANIDPNGHAIDLVNDVRLTNSDDHINLISNHLHYNHKTGYINGSEGISGSIDEAHIAADHVKYDPRSKTLKLTGNVCISSKL